MNNSTYNPQKVSDFEKDKVQFSGQSVYAVVNSTGITNVDLDLADDYLLTGGQFLVKNAKLGDTASLQIVHPTFGVVDQFVTNFRCSEDSHRQFDLQLPYPSKLPAGLKIRLVYNCTDTLETREVAINYYLHKVMV